jgi:hypothetical protein
MGYAEIVGHKGSDPHDLQRITTLVDLAKLMSTSSLAELYDVARVMVPPNFTFEYVELQVPDDRERYSLVDSKWVRLE